MKKILAILASGLLFTSVCAMSKDINDAISDCYFTKNSTVRLTCYDKVIGDGVKAYEAEKKQSASKYQSMDLLDLKTDIKSLSGKKVSVLGQVQMMGELAMLKATPMDMTPVMLDITKLAREDRKQMLKSCAAICDNVRINGTIHQGPIGATLNAEQVAWQ